MSWLPKAEDQLTNMQPVAGDPRSVRIQIEEMKVGVGTVCSMNYQLSMSHNFISNARPGGLPHPLKSDIW